MLSVYICGVKEFSSWGWRLDDVWMVVCPLGKISLLFESWSGTEVEDILTMDDSGGRLLEIEGLIEVESLVITVVTLATTSGDWETIDCPWVFDVVTQIVVVWVSDADWWIISVETGWTESSSCWYGIFKWWVACTFCNFANDKEAATSWGWIFAKDVLLVSIESDDWLLCNDIICISAEVDSVTEHDEFPSDMDDDKCGARCSVGPVKPKVTKCSDDIGVCDGVFKDWKWVEEIARWSKFCNWTVDGETSCKTEDVLDVKCSWDCKSETRGPETEELSFTISRTTGSLPFIACRSFVLSK